MFGAQRQPAFGARSQGDAPNRATHALCRGVDPVSTGFSFGCASHLSRRAALCARLARVDCDPRAQAAKFRDAYPSLSVDANAISVRWTPPGSLSPVARRQRRIAGAPPRRAGALGGRPPRASALRGPGVRLQRGKRANPRREKILGQPRLAVITLTALPPEQRIAHFRA